MVREKIMEQSYLVINLTTNTIDNLVTWDGNTNTWQPPQNCICEVQATTIGYVWGVLDDATEWTLVPVEGSCDIGFTWNPTNETGITNQAKPPRPPQTTGTQFV